MRVLIRTDVGGLYGFGHAKRMLGLAERLIDAGVEVAFATTTRALAAMVAVGHRCEVTMLHGALEPLVQARAPAVLVVDHPDPGPEGALARLRAVTRVVRIDHPDADPESCDLLILPNCHQDPAVVQQLSVAFEGRLLYGAPYALLDPAWGQARASMDTSMIAFLSGGTDPTGALNLMLAMSDDLAGALPEVTLCYLPGSGLMQP